MNNVKKQIREHHMRKIWKVKQKLCKLGDYNHSKDLCPKKVKKLQQPSNRTSDQTPLPVRNPSSVKLFEVSYQNLEREERISTSRKHKDTDKARKLHQTWRWKAIQATQIRVRLDSSSMGKRTAAAGKRHILSKRHPSISIKKFKPPPSGRSIRTEEYHRIS